MSGYVSLDRSPLPHTELDADLCVVGGGIAGLFAAVAAARHGARTVLMHDRPVLGGNASGECRVHICGADRHNFVPNMRETGPLEEIRMENLYRNPQASWGVWDTVLYEFARFQPNLTLLLNCACVDAEMEGPRIRSVTGYQTTSQTWFRIRAANFADCSGDAILAPLTGAAFRIGKEARGEFGESAAPETAQRQTMGMSILFQTRQHDAPQPFTPPRWAYTFDDPAVIPSTIRWWQMGYWWVELGGEQDSIGETEAIRDELLRVSYGVWDFIKNRNPATREAASHWALDWMQFIPGKRESRRYEGRHILTQKDIESGGRFDDLVAYGGWTMDDHPSTGFWTRKRGIDLPPAVHLQTPIPYGIPLRSLLARDIPNLMFAGRCHSATHIALSSTRVMGTGGMMGHAVGVAAALCAEKSITPPQVLDHVGELQQRLLRDDAYLPWTRQTLGDATAKARLTASQGNPEPLRDGINRPVGADTHAWRHRPGDWVAMEFDRPRQVGDVTLIVDSAMHMDPQMSYHQAPRPVSLRHLPAEMPRRFRVEVRKAGAWENLVVPADSHHRMIRLPVNGTVEAVRYTLQETWGSCDGSNLYAFYA